MFDFHPVALGPLGLALISAILLAYTCYKLHQRGMNRLLLAFAINLIILFFSGSVQFIWLILSDPAVMSQLHIPMTLLTALAAYAALVLAMEYTENARWYRWTREYAIGIAILLTIYLVILSVHPTPVATDTMTYGGMVLLELEQNFTPLTTPYYLFAYLHIVLVLFVFGRMLFHSRQIYRLQGVILLVAVVLPTSTSLLFWGFDVTVVDPTPTTQALSGLLFAFCIFRFKVYDVSPVARKNVIEQMNEGYLVLDEFGTIIDHNPAAAGLFDSDGELVGGAGVDVIPDVDTICSREGPDAVTLSPDGSDQYLSITASPMAYGGREGHLLIITDVTGRVERERELEMLNRVIRHDIQNDMNVVKGYADLAADEVENDEIIDPILTASTHAIELCESVRTVLETITEDGDLELEPYALADVLQAEMEKARTAHESARFELAGELDGNCQVLANQMISSVFTNLFNNAVQHSDRETPEITISVNTGSADTVTVRVADNGPGIEDDNKEEVLGRGEKGLESSGTGVGVYLVDTLLEEYGGTVHVEDNNPRGTVFVLDFQPADGVGDSHPGNETTVQID